MLGAGIAFQIVSLIVLALLLPSLSAAEPTDATNPAAPVVMELNAVTLELVCRDGATEGSFIRSMPGCSKQRRGAAVSSPTPT